MKLTEEKSQEQAETIKLLSLWVSELDTEYCRECAKQMKEQAHRQDTLSVLNPGHPLSANRILEKQAEALLKLCEFAEANKVIAEMKNNLKTEQDILDKIKNNFL